MKESHKAAAKTGADGAGDEAAALGLERLVFFSDAVYAIAITLLVIDLRLPAGSGELSNNELAAALWAMWPQLFSYVLSFLVIGSLWGSHHRKFRFIKGYDGRLVWINLLLLMVIAFVPFPTSVLAESGNATATILYAGTIVAASLLSALLWWHSVTHDLAKEGISARNRRLGFLSPLITAAVFGVSILIAFYNADWAKYFWVLLAPLTIWMR
jgi:uncharacterized membrane protein